MAREVPKPKKMDRHEIAIRVYGQRLDFHLRCAFSELLNSYRFEARPIDNPLPDWRTQAADKLIKAERLVREAYTILGFDPSNKKV